MNAHKVLVLALLVSGCASEWRGAKFSDAEAVQLFRRFERLHPPLSSTEARRAIGDPAWTARTSIWRQTMLGGYIPLRSDFLSGSSFCVALTKPKGQAPNYSIWLHTTSDTRTPEQLQAFFAGTGPRQSRVTEFSLCYPEWGRIRFFPDSLPRSITQ
jgi:hypothetical protein